MRVDEVESTMRHDLDIQIGRGRGGRNQTRRYNLNKEVAWIRNQELEAMMRFRLQEGVLESKYITPCHEDDYEQNFKDRAIENKIVNVCPVLNNIRKAGWQRYQSLAYDVQSFQQFKGPESLGTRCKDRFNEGPRGRSADETVPLR